MSCLFAGLLNLFLRPWRWRLYVPPKRWLKLNGLHSVISQKMILFITTAVKISNPTTNILYYTWQSPKQRQDETETAAHYILLTSVKSSSRDQDHQPISALVIRYLFFLLVCNVVSVLGITPVPFNLSSLCTELICNS
jgi:hypothetical protein